ncbi:NAD(P)-binding protein [Basidiobolus meristosporus CBS 931.73]|uniref:Very-long-chain 3-oxoacyl-CoA reductase n=1 Tax=Basidiobolus meristosporus CBS 931.73 TaxID=1314790 RepID=A0A1Y1XZN2_9FUNG|nr:NAD(P)-binding protein [Basidiobolus meristosporus CBS 931.73]|eukprot:ORX91220.1 NAD(P)-binding protein [Basidiobolus meristosporus CBS 931.73]
MAFESFFSSVQNSSLLSVVVPISTILGGLWALRVVLSFTKVIIDVYFRKGINLDQYGAGKGAWAIVTGCTDGIGKEFAFQLAKKKFNVVLISRTLSKLETLSSEIESQYSVETKVFPLDFTAATPQDFSDLKTFLESLEVSVLVNNVGANHEFPTPFAIETEDVINKIVEVNINGTLKMTRMVLPEMVSRQRGIILNLGSFSGIVPTPYLATYSATKAFTCAFSQALGAEVASKGIVVENINTYFVTTAMSKIRRPSFFIPSTKPFVASVLARIGVAGGASTPFTSTPFPSHAIANWFIDNTFSMSFWVMKNLAMQIDIRKRALRKREREAQKAAEAAKSQ